MVGVVAKETWIEDPSKYISEPIVHGICLLIWERGGGMWRSMAKSRTAHKSPIQRLADSRLVYYHIRRKHLVVLPILACLLLASLSQCSFALVMG